MYFLELLAEFNEEQKLEMRIIYKETEVIFKIIVTSIKTSYKTLDNLSVTQSKIKTKNLKLYE